jgi:hypothetical protein
MSGSSWSAGRWMAVMLVLAGALACRGEGTGREQSALVPVPDPGSIDPTGCDPAVINAHAHPAWQIPDSSRDLLLASEYCRMNIIEYHDEQRLWGGIDDLGPVVRIYASSLLGQIPDHRMFDGQWINVAIIAVEMETGATLPMYARLGLTASNVCLYASHVTESPGPHGVYEAVVSLPGPSGCVPSVVTRPTGTTLDVAVEKRGGPATDYPAVARFVESAGGGTRFGFRCGDRWCSAGIGAMKPDLHDGVQGQGSGPRWAIRGWSDEQVLSIPDPTTSSKLAAGMPASIIPADNLGTLRVAAFRNTYRQVASIYLDPRLPVPQKYVTGLGGSSTDEGYGLGPGFNDIELKVTGTGTSEVWTARITHRRTGRSVERKVIRTDHSTYGITSVVATARFRWRKDDEEIWIACDVGCCLIIQERA